MSRPAGMPLTAWQRIGKLPSDIRDRVLERAAILIYEAGLSPTLADERALVLEGIVAPTLPGVK